MITDKSMMCHCQWTVLVLNKINIFKAIVYKKYVFAVQGRLKGRFTLNDMSLHGDVVVVASHNGCLILRSASIRMMHTDGSVCVREEALAPLGAPICGAAASSVAVCGGDRVERDRSQGCGGDSETCRSGVEDCSHMAQVRAYQCLSIVLAVWWSPFSRGWAK